MHIAHLQFVEYNKNKVGDIMLNFAENLRKARENKGMSKTEIARYLGLSLTAYSLYEKGEREPNLLNLQKISIALDVTVDKLLKGENEDEEVEKAKLFWNKFGYVARRGGDIEGAPEERADYFVILSPYSATEDGEKYAMVLPSKYLFIKYTKMHEKMIEEYVRNNLRLAFITNVESLMQAQDIFGKEQVKMANW